MITRYYKIFTFFLLVSLSCVAYGEKIVPPLSIAELPTSIKNKSPKELAMLMAHIASWSYQVLLDVPQKGLKAQKEKLEQIIALRKWLQARQHPLFQLLTFKLIMAVNNIILDELFRKDMARQGTKIGSYDFKADSLNDELVKHLLLLNTVDEQALIKPVISFEGKIATYCRQQNYSVEDYLSGLILKKFSEELISYVNSWQEIPMITFQAKLSKPLVADLLFVEALKLVDKQRDVHLLTDIYFESGFPEKDMDTLIQSKLSKNERTRLNTSSSSTAMEITDTLYEFSSPFYDSYDLRMIISFLPFFDTLDVIPSKYFAQFHRKKFPRKFKRCMGLWLSFTEDMEQDKDKMTQEDQDRIRYCSILKTPSEIMQ